jgi:ribosomal protein S27AE
MKPYELKQGILDKMEIENLKERIAKLEKIIDDLKSEINYNKAIKNSIACPKCGNELIDTNPMIILTTHPAQKNVHCDKCDYVGYRII